MKFLVAILLTALLGYTAPLYSVWWTFAITSFIVSIAVLQKPFMSFLSGFLGLFFLWMIMAFIIDSANNHLLATKIAMILPLGGSVFLLIIITALIGGLVSGFAALSGSFVRGGEKVKKTMV